MRKSCITLINLFHFIKIEFLGGIHEDQGMVIFTNIYIFKNILKKSFFYKLLKKYFKKNELSTP